MTETTREQTMILYTPHPEQAAAWYASVLGWKRESGYADILLLDDDKWLQFVSGTPLEEMVRLKTRHILDHLASLKQAAIAVGKIQTQAEGLLELMFEDPYGQRILLWQDTTEHPVRGACRVK